MDLTDGIGGRIGEEFKKALKNNSLAEFSRTYPYEASQLQPFFPRFSSPRPSLNSNLITLVLIGLFLAIGSSGFFFIRSFIQRSSMINQSKATPAPVLGIKTSDLAFLNNDSQGYKLLYPKDFKVTNEDNGIWLTPPSNKGKVIVYIKDAQIDISIEKPDDATSQDIEVLNQVADLVKNNIKFTQHTSFSNDQLQERFMNTTGLPVN